MSWIKEINTTEAKGLLQKEYNAALNRSGRIWNIVKCMSIHPEAMKSSMELYKCLMFAPSPLTRSEREMLAVVVSARTDDSIEFMLMLTTSVLRLKKILKD